MALIAEAAMPIIVDDRRAVVAAASAVARHDEALIRTPALAGMARQVTLRSEAISMAALEGAACRVEGLARLQGDPDGTLSDRGARVAADMAAALALAAEWPESGPDAAMIAEAFRAADSSSGRLMKPDVTWTLEEDSEATSAELALVAETPEPWTALEAVRRVWSSNRFFGTSRRIALVSTGWAVARGFGASAARPGIASAVRRSPESFKEAARSQDEWAAACAAAVAESSRVGAAAIDDVAALRATLAALCPSDRSSSSVSAALDYLIVRPVTSAKALSDALDVTPRGAKVVLDKLVDAGVLDVEGGARNRRFVCRRAL